MSAKLEKLLVEICACRACEAHLPHPLKPALRSRPNALFGEQNEVLDERDGEKLQTIPAALLSLPHPSWHNNPWFGEAVLPEIMRRVSALVA